MLYAYPYRLKREDDALLIGFPDIAEAHSFVAVGTPVEEIDAMAADCLLCALGGYVELGRALPRASAPKRGQRLATLSALPGAKLALYEAMRAARLSNAALARRLGLQENAVRRLLDLDHRSHIGEVERALAALGRRLVVKAEAA